MWNARLLYVFHYWCRIIKHSLIGNTDIGDKKFEKRKKFMYRRDIQLKVKSFSDIQENRTCDVEAVARLL